MRLGEPKLSEVTATAAHLFRVDPDALRSHDRHHPMVDYRHVAMAACRMLTSASFPAIGRHFGRFHHTSVLSACRRVAADPLLFEEAVRVREAVLAMLEGQ